MILDWMRLISLVGPISIFILLIVLALLSKRMGSVTRAAPYYGGFYVAALFMGMSIGLRLFDDTPRLAESQSPVHVLIYTGLPALAVTIAVIVAWRYWSWLFAERS